MECNSSNRDIKGNKNIKGKVNQIGCLKVLNYSELYILKVALNKADENYLV